MNEKVELNLNPAGVSIKIEERSKGRMKIQIKLSKDEATGFKNFVSQLKPENLTVDDFTKAIFFTGLNAMGQSLQKTTVEYVKAHREELEASGMDVKQFFEDVGPEFTDNIDQIEG
tara:strand:- start:288 stop:635 length:348 start_codon:yes stop_codon:yes gene_type:complete